MNALTEIRLGSKLFYDREHFPNGFGRSGDFTISQAYTLQHYGDTMSKLSSGELSPENEEEIRFVSVCKGQYEAMTPYEKVWLKYLEKSKPKAFHNLFSRNAPASNDDSEDLSADDSEDLLAS